MAPRAPAGLLWARRGKGGKRRWCRSVAGRIGKWPSLSPSCFTKIQGNEPLALRLPAKRHFVTAKICLAWL